MTSCQRCFVLTLMIGLTLSDWVTKTGLPHTTAYMAVGSYNDAIFILGGYGASIGKQVVEYSVTDQGFTDHGDEMQYNAYGGGDFYTQIGNTIYMLSGSGSNLNTFDMTNRAYTSSWKSVSTPVSHTGCLASSSIANIDYIYVVGGYDSSNVLNKVQVLNTNTMQWLSNIPSMKTQRNRLSCIVDPSTLQLYAIAGKNNGGATDPASFLKTIEKIDVNNMGGNQWGIISSTLTFPAIGTRSIIYQERILVIGGRYADNGYKYLKTIHVIDPQTDEVTLPYTSLPRGVADAAAVIMNGNLYVFGGSICSGTTDCNTAWISYMILQLPTPSPTSDPTNKPSHQPTVSPTFNPTIDPTVTPTSDPTTIPSFQPTFVSSMSPSTTPITRFSPTTTPTTQPILPPSMDPSMLPVTQSIQLTLGAPSAYATTPITILYSTGGNHENNESKQDAAVKMTIISTLLGLGVLFTILICAIRWLRKKRVIPNNTTPSMDKCAKCIKCGITSSTKIEMNSEFVCKTCQDNEVVNEESSSSVSIELQRSEGELNGDTNGNTTKVIMKLPKAKTKGEWMY
eukprot:1099003_1